MDEQNRRHELDLEFRKLLDKTNYHPLYKPGGKTVCLYGLSVLGLILEDASSDVTYFNQTTGFSCHQRKTKGVFVFVDDDVKELYNVIALYMTNKEKLSVEDADFLDTAFTSSYGAKHLSVDRTKLGESGEAWIYVKIDPHVENGSYAGFSAETGILTWDNSD